MSTLQPTTPNQYLDSSLVAASAHGAKFLILLQISSRFLTFAVNQLLLRYLSPALLGVSAQLELFSLSVIYFSREALRNSLLRQNINAATEHKRVDNSNAQAVVNLSWLTVLLGLVFASILGLSYVQSTNFVEQPYFQHALFLYILATLVELAAEPGFAICQQKMMYKVRATAESSAAFVKCLVTYGVTIWAARSEIVLGPLAFAIGQVVFAFILFSVYTRRLQTIAASEGFTIWPRSIVKSVPMHYTLLLITS